MFTIYTQYGLQKDEVFGYYENEYSETLGAWIFHRKDIETGNIIKELHKVKLAEVRKK